MTLTARHRRRGRHLRSRQRRHRRPRHRQHLAQFRTRRRARAHQLQHLGGGGLGPTSGFDQHGHSIPQGYDIHPSQPPSSRISRYSSTRKLPPTTRFRGSSAAVAVTLTARHRRRGRHLRSRHRRHRRPRHRQHLTQLRTRRRARAHQLQHLGGGGLGPTSGFDQHGHSIPQGYDIHPSQPPSSRISRYSSTRKLPPSMRSRGSSAAVAVTLTARHRRRGRHLRSRHRRHRRPRHRQHLTQLRTRRRARAHQLQHLGGGGLGPTSGFDQHGHSIPQGCDSHDVGVSGRGSDLTLGVTGLVPFR